MHVVDGNTTPEFTRLLVQIAEGYPTSGHLSEGTIRIYAWALGDYTVAQIRDACVALFRVGSGFFPSTVEILRQLGQVSTDDAGLLAWAQFRQAAADVGGYASLDVDDAAAGQALLDVFGTWPAYCEQSDGPAMAERRKEFLAAYRAARGRMIVGRPLRLPGSLEGAPNYAPSPVGMMTLDGRVFIRAPRAIGSGASEIEP